MNILNNLGLSISYNRVLELENMLATAVCKQFEDEGVVCPAKLRKGLFVVGAVDNLDYNPSSTTAQDSFHGTGISVFQFPTVNNSGICRDPVVINPSLDSTNFSLPEKYSNVPAATTKINDLVIPEARLAEIKVMWKELKMKNLGGLSMPYYSC